MRRPGYNPDPVRKRLFFLLLKHREQRRAAEKELAMRASADTSQPFLLEGNATAATAFIVRRQAPRVQPLTSIPIQRRIRAGQTLRERHR